MEGKTFISFETIMFRIRDLSDEALTLLTSHLNMPSYGSLKNWDSIGIQLGVSDHEIMVNDFILLYSCFQLMDN